jgi:hypothetical protein
MSRVHLSVYPSFFSWASGRARIHGGGRCPRTATRVRLGVMRRCVETVARSVRQHGGREALEYFLEGVPYFQ